MSFSFVAGRGKEWRPPRKEWTSKSPGIDLKYPELLFSPSSLTVFPSFYFQNLSLSKLPRMTPGGDEYHESFRVMG